MNDIIQKVRLVKFLAAAGVAARRKVAQLIKDGQVTVNDQVITDPSVFVSPDDVVVYQERRVRAAKMVYILFNKPTGCLTTLHDERKRKTIFDVLMFPKNIHVFPVGRLDQNTTGLLLLTNDGEFAQRLSHPRFNVSKSYLATLDRPMEQKDLVQLRHGILLRDGFIKPDRVAIKARSRGNCVIVELHSGKKRVVRRMFAHLGYHVIQLDRFRYAGLDKRRLAVGAWRFLLPAEVARLKNAL